MPPQRNSPIEALRAKVFAGPVLFLTYVSAFNVDLGGVAQL